MIHRRDTGRNPKLGKDASGYGKDAFHRLSTASLIKQTAAHRWSAHLRPQRPHICFPPRRLVAPHLRATAEHQHRFCRTWRLTEKPLHPTAPRCTPLHFSAKESIDGFQLPPKLIVKRAKL